LLREASADGEAARHKSEARAKAAAAHKYHAGDECMARYQVGLCAARAHGHMLTDHRRTGTGTRPR